MNQARFLFNTLYFAVVLTALAAQPACAAKKDNLVESTMGENISGMGNFRIQSSQVFGRASREVMWFGHFRFLTANQARLNIEWLTPAGEVFKKEQFTTQFSNCDYGWAKLDIKGKDAAALELEGEWTAKVYWDEEPIDTQKFFMGAKRFQQAPVIQQPASLPAPVIDSAEGHIRLAKVYFSKEDTPRAITELVRAQSVEPDKPEAFIILGNVYNSVGRSDEAIMQFTKAKTLKADESAVRRGLGNAYAKLALYDDAVREYAALSKLDSATREDGEKLRTLHRKMLEQKALAGATK